MKVTNSGTAPWGVYLGGSIKLIRPGESRELALEDDDLVQARKIDALSFEEVVKPESDEKAELLAKLKALGIDAGKNSGIETLQKRLAEAESAAEKQKVMDELNELKVEFDKEANLEALQAALAAVKQ